VANALVAIHDCGFAADHGQYIAFRADRGAGRAADTLCVIDVGVLRLRALREDFALFGSGSSLLFPNLQLLEVPTKKDPANNSGYRKSN
jgi:hypothetical protein